MEVRSKNPSKAEKSLRCRGPNNDRRGPLFGGSTRLYVYFDVLLVCGHGKPSTVLDYGDRTELLLQRAIFEQNLRNYGRDCQNVQRRRAHMENDRTVTLNQNPKENPRNYSWQLRNLQYRDIENLSLEERTKQGSGVLATFRAT